MLISAVSILAYLYQVIEAVHYLHWLLFKLTYLYPYLQLCNWLYFYYTILVNFFLTTGFIMYYPQKGVPLILPNQMEGEQLLTKAKNTYNFLISHVDFCIFLHQVQSQLTSARCLLCASVTGADSDRKRPFKISIFERAAKICPLARTLKLTVLEGTIVGRVSPGQSYEPVKDKLRATAFVSSHSLYF